MLLPIRLLATALAFASQMFGLLPALAQPRVVGKADGITVFEDSVARATGGTGSLLVARLEPSRMSTGVVEGSASLPTGSPWSVTINGSYFDDAGTPLYHLRDGARVFAPFRKGTNAVFWCEDGRCAIQHSTEFKAGRPYDVAVQAAPRLMERGKPTKGVRGADLVDGRAGLALAEDGAVLVFVTSPLSWGGLSFNELRDVLAEKFEARSILMMDGGNSARLRIEIGEMTFSNGPFSREVPYSLRFSGRLPEGT